MDISELQDTFFDEADELLVDVERILLDMDPATPADDDLHAIFRAVHSVKGGAGTFGFTRLQNTAHTLENVLDRVRNHELAISRERIDIFLQARDVLADQIGRYRSGESADEQACDTLCARLAVFEATDGETPDEPSTAAAAPAADGAVVLAIQIRDVPESEHASLLEELALFGTVIEHTGTASSLDLVLSSTESSDDIEAVLCFVVNADQITIEKTSPEPRSDAPDTAAPADIQQPADDDRSTPAGPAAARTSRDGAKNAESASLRVSTDKVDDIINLVGELVISQSMLEQTVSQCAPDVARALAERMSQLQRNTRDLQEAVMSIRMMPMDYAFNRFPRLVRDLSANLGKQIVLETEGGATELDKGLIERIMDPLTHLVRNSLDHGIETPAVRVEAGKPEHGTITLIARHQGGNILIEIRDDGAGLVRDKILAKAEEKELPLSDHMRDEDVWQLIFEPGFSTADKVSDVSGRGVGMDVVKSNIQQLGGHIELHSEPGRGTSTRIALPLTLAVMDGMAIRVGAETLILPVGAIMESIQVSADQIRPIAGSGRVVRIRDDYLTLIELNRFFNIADAETELTRGIIIVVQSEGRSFALFVDELIGERQVVVKNLETHFRKIDGISAATILGDGSVALILDVIGLSRAARERSREAEAVEA